MKIENLDLTPTSYKPPTMAGNLMHPHDRFQSWDFPSKPGEIAENMRD